VKRSERFANFHIGGISIVYTYYNNPLMLERMVRHLNSLSSQVKSRIEVLVVDDGSQEAPAGNLPYTAEFDLKIFRVEVDKPWNQSGARNLGSAEA